MVITQKITSMAFEIHDGKTCVGFCFSSSLETKVPDVAEVKVPLRVSGDFRQQNKKKRKKTDQVVSETAVGSIGGAERAQRMVM